MLCRRLITSTAAATALVVGIPLQAQTDAENQSAMPLAGTTLPAETLRESRFRILDLDGDNFITREEVHADDAVLTSQFRSLDRNDDGRLSEAEYVLFGVPESAVAE